MSTARITVNGVELTPAQSMAVSAALSAFLMQTEDPDQMALLGEVGPLCRERMLEVQRLMLTGSP